MKRKTNPSFLSSLPSFHSSILLTSTLLAIVLWLFSFATLLRAVPQLSIVEGKINRPHTGELLSGKVGIFGLARGTMFKEYRLEYTPISTGKERTVSTGWRQIGGRATAPVTETGFLGQWDAQRLRGEFLIRLVVVSTQGDEVQDQIRIFIENERPRLEVSDPSEDLLTLQKQITVRGTTEKSNTVTLKSEQINMSLPVDLVGRICRAIALERRSKPNRDPSDKPNRSGYKCDPDCCT